MHFWLHHAEHRAENICLCVLARRLCGSRKGETGGGGWGHLQGDMQMVAARLASEEPWLGLGGPPLAAWTGLENSTFTLYGAEEAVWALSRCLTTASTDCLHAH